MGRRLTQIERFWCKTRIENGCLIWTAAQSVNRSGSRPVFAPIGTKTVLASRWIYMQALGPIPTGMDVMHSCDNGLCVALQHLSIGSRTMNMQDAAAKGRTSRGEQRPLATLTEVDVVEIRRRFASGECQADLAREFEVAPVTLFRIVRGERWKYAGGPIQPKRGRR